MELLLPYPEKYSAKFEMEKSDFRGVWTARLRVDYSCDGSLRTMVGPDDSLNVKLSHPARIQRVEVPTCVNTVVNF